jgi:hypothetical protein
MASQYITTGSSVFLNLDTTMSKCVGDSESDSPVIKDARDLGVILCIHKKNNENDMNLLQQ